MAGEKPQVCSRLAYLLVLILFQKSIFPFLFRWQCLRALERVGATVKFCVGEADFELSADGCKDHVYLSI